MLFVSLTLSDQAYGLMNLIAIIINFIVSSIVLKKALEQKRREISIFFVVLFFTGVTWLPNGIQYIYWVFTGNLFPITADLFPFGFLTEVGALGAVISFIAWLYLYMKLIHPLKSKMLILILTIFIVLSAIFIIYISYYSHFAPGAPVYNMVGYRITPFISELQGYVLIYALIMLIMVLITGIHFSLKSMRVKDNLVVQWKGKFLFISFIFYFIGEMDFMSMFLGIEFAVITRLILIISNILFYIGFIMPNFMKNALKLKE